MLFIYNRFHSNTFVAIYKILREQIIVDIIDCDRDFDWYVNLVLKHNQTLSHNLKLKNKVYRPREWYLRS